MKVFYRAEMVAESGSYSPSAEKPKAVVEDWLAHHLPIALTDFMPVSQADLGRVHAPSYVEGVFHGRIANGQGNYSARLAASTLWTVGSLVAAAQAAMLDGMTCSPSSGFHHACYTSGGGYCTFNGLMVAATHMLDSGTVKRVGILDCDWHYGNGTADIIQQLKLRDRIVHRTSGSELFRDGATQYMKWLEQSLEQLWQADVGLIIYQAGADAHRDDPLGGLLDDDQLIERDQLVFDYCQAKSLPITWCLAGGYQRDQYGGIEPVLRIHRHTAEQAISAFA